MVRAKPQELVTLRRKWAFAGNISVARSCGDIVMLPLNNDLSEKGQILVCGGSNTSSENAIAVVELLTPNPSTNYTTITIQTIAFSNFARMLEPSAYHTSRRKNNILWRMRLAESGIYCTL
jgi:hypothetical protein